MDLGDKSSGFADLKNTVDRGSAESFGPVSGFCHSRSSDIVDRIINFRSALVNVLVFCRRTFHFRGIECVAFFYHEGAKRDDFIQKNKFRCCVDSSQWGSVVKHVW